MKPRHLLMLLAGAGVASLWLWGDGPNSADAEVALPVPAEARRNAAAGATPAQAAQAHATVPGSSPASASSPALRPRAELLAAWRQGQRPERLFAPTSWAPPPPAPAPVVAQAPLPPVAPPLPFRYIGRQTQGGQQEAFLAEGERVHVVRAGSVIAGRWRVEALGAQALTLTYLPLNQTQQLVTRATE